MVPPLWCNPDACSCGRLLAACCCWPTRVGFISCTWLIKDDCCIWPKFGLDPAAPKWMKFAPTCCCSDCDWRAGMFPCKLTPPSPTNRPEFDAVDPTLALPPVLPSPYWAISRLELFKVLLDGPVFDWMQGVLLPKWKAAVQQRSRLASTR